MWLGDPFGDKNFLDYTIEMMNCICWVNYAIWGIRWIIVMLIDVINDEFWWWFKYEYAWCVRIEVW